MELGGTSGYLLSGLDYALFVFVLVISFLIGIYYGFFSKNKQNTPKEYFFGGQKMGVIPISMSLVVSSISGVAIIGQTADIYAHGTPHWQFIFSIAISLLITAFIILPVFYELQLPSTFSYLELRFGRIVERLASFMFLILSAFYVSINMYIPALLLNHLAGLPITLTVIVLGCVCIFYTTIGGFRAVIWADLFQAVLMVVYCVGICCIGIGLIGGIDVIWEALKRGNKLILFDFNPDPTIRLSTWTILFGHTFVSLQIFGINQMSVQRYLSITSLSKARKAVFIFGFAFLFFLFLSFVMGIVMYANYETCDPLTSGRIKQLDQITSLFVIEIANQFPGLPGLFVAGIVSASLSTMSSTLNSSTVCLYEDFLRPFLPNMTNEKACKLLKLITLLLGLIKVALVFLVMKLGTVFSIFVVVFGLIGGIMAGLFSMGMLLPKANQKGALIGTISSLIGVGSIIIGSFFKKPEVLPQMRTDGCQHNFTSSAVVIEDTEDNLPWIFRISFLYYGTLGFMLVFLIGYPVSLLTGGNEITDQRLLTPFMRKKRPDLHENDAEEHFLQELTMNFNNNEVN